MAITKSCTYTTSDLQEWTNYTDALKHEVWLTFEAWYATHSLGPISAFDMMEWITTHKIAVQKLLDLIP